MTNSWKSRKRNRRRGVATIWFLAAMPALIALLLVLLELGHLWAARVELENSMEASALAAVKSWGSGGGTAGSNWTNAARLRGQTLAAANTINGNAVAIGTNLGTFNLATNPNENAAYLPAPGQVGNLVFGGASEPVAGSWTFDGTATPTCGNARILVDATGSGNLFSGSRNEWGIAFLESTNPALRIVQVEIDLTAVSPAVIFSGTAELDTALDTFSTAKVKDGAGTFQQDNLGFDNLVNNMLSGQAVASYSSTTVLRITFSPGTLDDGFAPGDRLRFAQQVISAGGGGSNQDGDDIGGTIVRITFSDSTTSVGTLLDTENSPVSPATVDPLGLIVNTAGIPSLPPPATSSVSNDGQGFVQFLGGGGGAATLFAVRAQGVIAVPSLFGSYFGGTYSTHNITVDTTAIYDCTTGRAELVRIDNYVHP